MAKGNVGLTSSTFVTKKHLLYIAFFVLMVVGGQLLLAPPPYNLLPFALIGGAFFVALTFRYPIIGLHVYLFFFLIRPQELFPHAAIMAYPYEKVVGIIVIVSLILNYIVTGRKFELFDLDKGVLFLVGAAAVSVIGSVWVTGAKDMFIMFFKIILVYLFTARIANTERKFKSIIWLYVFSVAFMAVSSAINYYLGNYEVAMGIERAAGFGGAVGSHSDPNSMASSLVLGMPFIFAVMKSYRNMFVKSFLGLLLAVCLWTVVISGSRGGMLGAIVMLMLIALISRYKAPALIIATAAVISVAAIMPQQYVDRFTTIVRYNDLDDETGAAYSAQGRIKGLKVGFEILLERPLNGVGIGCFSVYNYEHHGSWLQPHNLVGQLIGELGLIGLLAFGYFVYKLTSNVRLIRSGLRALNLDRGFNFQVTTAVMISVAMLFFLGLFAHNLYRFNWYLLASFTAIMARFVEYRFQSKGGSSENAGVLPKEVVSKDA